MAPRRGRVRTQLELIGDDKYRKGLKSAQRSLETFGRGGTSVMQSFGPMTAAIAAGGIAVAALGRAMGDFVRDGAAYSRVVESHAVSLAEADAATSGLIDTTALHRQAAMLQMGGLRSTSREMRAMGVAAATLAQRTGAGPGGATAAFERLTTAVRSGSTEAFREFGIDLEGVTGLANIQREAVQRLTEEYGDQSVATRDLSDDLYQLQNNWSTAWGEMYRAIDEEGGLIRGIIQGISEAIGEAANALGAMNRARDNLARMGNQAEQRDIREELRRSGFDPAGGRLPLTLETGFGSGLGMLAGRDEAWAASQRARLDELIQAESLALGSGRESVFTASAPSEGGPDRADSRRRGGSGSRVARKQVSAAQIEHENRAAWIARELEAAEQSSERWAEMQRRLGEVLLEIQDRVNQAKEAERDMIARQIEAETELADKRAEAEAELSAAQAARYSRTMESIAAASEFTSVAGNIFGMIAENLEAQGKAADGWRKAQGVALGLYHTISAIGEGAKMIGAIAEQNYPGAALHLASAVQHGVAAAMAYSQLAQGGGGGGAKQAQPASMFRSSRRKEDSGVKAGQESITNQYYLMGRTDAHIGRMVERSRYVRQRTGMASGAPNHVGYR